MSACGGKADSASDCRGQFCGASRILHAAGASDLVLRNVNTGQFEVYDIVNNQIRRPSTLARSAWISNLAVSPSILRPYRAHSRISRAINSRRMAGFGGGAADNSNDISLGDDMSQHTFLTAPDAWPADSERIEPFVDIARLFAEKCPHWASPGRIEKQMLFRGECPQFVYPPLTGVRSTRLGCRPVKTAG